MDFVKTGEVGVVLIDGQKGPERRNMEGHSKRGTRLNGLSKVALCCNSVKEGYSVWKLKIHQGCPSPLSPEIDSIKVTKA
jgi:hypothetical protein